MPIMPFVVMEHGRAVWASLTLSMLAISSYATKTELARGFNASPFAKNLAGHRLMTNARHLRGSAWINFLRIVNKTWICDSTRTPIAVRTCEGVALPL